MPAGRPSLYSKAYCDEVIAVGYMGLSLTAFAGHIGVSRSTIGEWINEYPEFSVACKKAQAKRTMFLEQGMLEREATGPMVTARRFALANAAPDEWREKQAVELTGANGGPVQHQLDATKLSTSALEELAKAMNATAEPE